MVAASIVLTIGLVQWGRYIHRRQGIVCRLDLFHSDIPQAPMATEQADVILDQHWPKDGPGLA
jgi:hypothetical protein